MEGNLSLIDACFFTFICQLHDFPNFAKLQDSDFESFLPPRRQRIYRRRPLNLWHFSNTNRETFSFYGKKDCFLKEKYYFCRKSGKGGKFAVECA